ncbi:TPA: glycosyltransferase, partial [Escherichia coli]|nr:glycosyltransferase [Escherichia coli]
MVRETVSIIMPAYNASATIEQAVNSVIDQDFKDWHLY